MNGLSQIGPTSMGSNSVFEFQSFRASEHTGVGIRVLNASLDFKGGGTASAVTEGLNGVPSNENKPSGALRRQLPLKREPKGYDLRPN